MESHSNGISWNYWRCLMELHKGVSYVAVKGWAVRASRKNPEYRPAFEFVNRYAGFHAAPAESPVAVDPTTHELIGREVKHRRCITPQEERWMTYGCLIQGAKGIMHWNYGSGLLRPPNWFSEDQWVIRASLGGVLGHKPHGYEIPKDVADDLRAVWDEIGQINVELRAVGPLVAVSDVSELARVVAVTLELSPQGEPAAEAAALVCGLDSIVLIVLNHNLITNWKADADQGLQAYDPVDATVELTLPPWFSPEHTFRVRHDGTQKLTPQRRPGRLVFHFGKLEVSSSQHAAETHSLLELQRSWHDYSIFRSAGSDILRL